MAARVKVWGMRVVAALFAAVMALIGYLAVLHYNGNFHTVIAGELYRSGQPTGGQLEKYAKEAGLQSVLNLRGASPGSDWYDAEVAQSEKLGLAHADFALSASRQVTHQEAIDLIALMRALPKPLLIHCKHGSDRTGLLAALYLAAIAGEDADTAAGQLSLYFGHFAVPYLSAAYPMDESWDRLEGDLKFAEN